MRVGETDDGDALACAAVRAPAWPGPDKCSPRVRLARPLVRKKRFLLPLRSTPTTQISSISLANAKSSTDKVIPSTDSAYRGYSTPPLPDEMRLDFALDCDWTLHGDRLVWLRDGGLIRHGEISQFGQWIFWFCLLQFTQLILYSIILTSLSTLPLLCI